MIQKSQVDFAKKITAFCKKNTVRRDFDRFFSVHAGIAALFSAGTFPANPPVIHMDLFHHKTLIQFRKKFDRVKEKIVNIFTFPAFEMSMTGNITVKTHFTVFYDHLLNCSAAVKQFQGVVDSRFRQRGVFLMQFCINHVSCRMIPPGIKI
jgi:hypothetical protein